MKILIPRDEFNERASDLIARIVGVLPEETIDHVFAGDDYSTVEAFVDDWMRRFYAPYNDFRHIYEEQA